jgi:hypothetical protein
MHTYVGISFFELLAFPSKIFSPLHHVGIHYVLQEKTKNKNKCRFLHSLLSPRALLEFGPLSTFALCPCFGKTCNLGLYPTHNIIIHAS